MMPRSRLLFATLVALLVPRVALAHPGHALGGSFGSIHYLLDPSHGGMVPVAIVLGAGALVWLLGNRRPRLRPVRAHKPKPEARDRDGDRR